MGKQRAATMSEVAQRVGVSKMTVSAVLAGGSRHVRVSEPTRVRVLETARQMGYRPNAVARSLRRQRTHILGFYCGFGYINAATPFCGDIIGGLQAGCDAHGRAGVLAAAGARGIEVSEHLAELNQNAWEGLLNEWQILPRDRRATAAVCWNDACAYELLEACHARGIRVPDDLAVTGFDDIR